MYINYAEHSGKLRGRGEKYIKSQKSPFLFLIFIYFLLLLTKNDHFDYAKVGF